MCCPGDILRPLIAIQKLVTLLEFFLFVRNRVVWFEWVAVAASAVDIVKAKVVGTVGNSDLITAFDLFGCSNLQRVPTHHIKPRIWLTVRIYESQRPSQNPMSLSRAFDLYLTQVIVDILGGYVVDRWLCHLSNKAWDWIAFVECFARTDHGILVGFTVLICRYDIPAASPWVVYVKVTQKRSD